MDNIHTRQIDTSYDLDEFNNSNLENTQITPPPPTDSAVTPTASHSKTEEKTKKLTVVFCIPGDTFSNNFLLCWTELIAYCLTNNITPVLSNATDSNVFFVRNKCLMGNFLNGITQKPFQGKVDYDYIMWIDSDQVFNVEMFKKLLSHDKDIVSGMYIMRDTKHFAIVPEMKGEDLLKNGSFKFLDRDTLIEWKKEHENSPLMSIDYCGMGFMLMKKGLLEQLEYPWFQPLTTTITDASNNVVVQDFNSEDHYLCKRMKDLGYEILIDTDILVGHEKKMIL